MTKSKKKSSHKTTRFSKYFLKNIILAMIMGMILLAPGQNVYTTEEIFLELTPPSANILPKIIPSSIPVNTTGIYPQQEITAAGVIVRDVDSGIFLYKRNENIRLSPASTTKILTALTALDLFSLDRIMTVRNPVKIGQTMGLFDGEKMTFENLLYGILIQSGNDAAYAIAANYDRGTEAFIELMNQKAQELLMTSSSFTNPAGFDDPDHKVSAIDLSKMAIAAIRNPVVSKMVAIPSITISDVTHTYYHNLKNINELLGRIPGVGGIKTGWTEDAGENLVTYVDRGGRRVIIVILRSQNRFLDTENLINWVYLNHRWQDAE